ncbi:MAG TPA: lysozyme [Acidobacteriaceae bacterium]|jgi:lysozyme|nr:lysozyme [Acidobacteriaceae bacterium]
MHLSETGLTLLKRSEGFRGSVYRDIAGFRTIGYGHRLLPGEVFANGITFAIGEELVAKDVLIAEANVNRLVKVELTQGQFDALVDFVFNLGSGRLATSTLLAELNAGRYEAAAQQLLAWDHAGNVEVAALRIRRHAEFELFNQEEAA